MRFDDWTYLWPPRPDNKVSKTLLNYYEKQKWVAQAKLNGTCNVMAVSPDRKTIKAMTRHNEPHKLWSPSTHTAKTFADLPGNGWYVFVAELMHSKVPGIRDINYIHDVLVADGEYLVGATLAERQAILQNLFPVELADKTPLSHFVIDEHTWLVRNHTAGFGNLFEKLDAPEHEGLVLKNPQSKLSVCSRQATNQAWQVKCRRPHTNYGF